MATTGGAGTEEARGAGGTSDVLALRGRPEPFAPWARLTLLLLFAAGLALRLYDLSAEGFADDEVHKWLAVNRYLTFDFVGDDIEHPMLMKWLITATLVIGKSLSWAPETIVRLPNVLVGALSIPVVALLGRRVLGELPAVVGAAVVALSPTMIGYQRVAKEDTLLGFFLMITLLCLAEAKAAADDGRTREQVRWEWWTAAAIGLMMASKYFFHFAVVPVLAYAWLRRTGTEWRVPAKRWGELILGALVVFGLVNWTPFMPSSWAYGVSYMREQQTIHGSLFFMGEIHHNLPSHHVLGTPPWFYVVFAAVKLAPLTFLLAVLGLAIAIRERRPGHVVILSWMALWFVVFSVSGAKWGRFFQTILPAFGLLAGHAIEHGARWLEQVRGTPLSVPARAAAIAALVVPLAGAEAWAAVTHAPRYRLYVSSFGGGDENLQWFFPHCDYYDSGFREAMAKVAKEAEPGAELSTEIDWVARYYAEVYGRKDLVHTLPRKGLACKEEGRPCYVFVQSGRWYFLNQEALEHLEGREPWYVEKLNGQDVVKVYRFAPGETLFPRQQLSATTTGP